MEYLDVVNEKGEPTGEIIERKAAHAQGVMHRTAHVWLLRKRENHIEILFQKRCEMKDSFPGCYDTSSAGHIPAGIDFAPSALRELKEELGMNALAEQLIPCGHYIEIRDEVFHGKPFHDQEYVKVFALWCDLDESAFHLQPEEVSAVLWMELNKAVAAINEDTIPHCVNPAELKLIEKAVECELHSICQTV